MKYENNKSVRDAVKEECKRQGKTLSGLARDMDILPQQINDLFQKKHITFDDLARLADALHCDLFFGLVKRDHQEDQE